MKFTAVGDALIQQHIPSDFAGYEEITPYIMQGDARFFNLETTLHRAGECFASQFSGGSYLRADPELLDDVKKFGFNLTSFNNNHTMDFSYGGLLSTLRVVNASGLVHAGVGESLQEASMPRYLQTEHGKVALIAVNTSFDPSMMAGNPSPAFPARPGINGLRLEQVLQVSKNDIEYIRDLEEKLNLNVVEKDERATGYLPPLPDDIAELGALRFREGETVEKQEFVCDEDWKRVEAAIKAASLEADYTIISFHTHQIDSERVDLPTRFSVDFAHRCIDAGANAFISHGPHLLRPIEIYKDSPIFYSLGDFILQLYSIPAAPADFYQKYGLSPDASVYELLKTRSRNFTVGLMEDERMLQTVIPYWETNGKQLTKLTLLPLTLVKTRDDSEIGLPRIAKNPAFMDAFAKESEKFGVTMRPNDDGTYTCEW